LNGSRLKLFDCQKMEYTYDRIPGEVLEIRQDGVLLAAGVALCCSCACNRRESANSKPLSLLPPAG